MAGEIRIRHVTVAGAALPPQRYFSGRAVETDAEAAGLPAGTGSAPSIHRRGHGSHTRTCRTSVTLSFASSPRCLYRQQRDCW